MQKLPQSVDDDIYAMLHSHIGRGSIGRFACDAIRPQLHQAAQGKTGTAFGMLSHLAKLVDANAVAEAKRRYMEKRYAAKQAT